MNKSIYDLIESRIQTVNEHSDGVGYYNIDNKDNKDNKDNGLSTSSWHQSSTPPQMNQEATLNEAVLLPLERDSQEREEVVMEDESPTPTLAEEQIARALYTFYDNGESAKQRYKLKVTLNLAENQNEREEFIATLTKDRRNFKKYLPEGAEAMLEFVDGIRGYVKENYNTYPYIGKFHYNHGWNSQQEQRNTNEPYCAAAVYWDGSNWIAVSMLYDFLHTESLAKNGLTPQQKKTNAIAHAIWFNPLHNKQKRNGTFRDKRRG
jgi:hypothetical protein